MPVSAVEQQTLRLSHERRPQLRVVTQRVDRIRRWGADARHPDERGSEGGQVERILRVRCRCSCCRWIQRIQCLSEPGARLLGAREHVLGEYVGGGRGVRAILGDDIAWLKMPSVSEQLV